MPISKYRRSSESAVVQACCDFLIRTAEDFEQMADRKLKHMGERGTLSYNRDSADMQVLMQKAALLRGQAALLLENYHRGTLC